MLLQVWPHLFVTISVAYAFLLYEKNDVINNSTPYLKLSGVGPSNVWASKWIYSWHCCKVYSRELHSRCCRDVVPELSQLQGWEATPLTTFSKIPLFHIGFLLWGMKVPIFFHGNLQHENQNGKMFSVALHCKVNALILGKGEWILIKEQRKDGAGMMRLQLTLFLGWCNSFLSQRFILGFKRR